MPIKTTIDPVKGIVQEAKTVGSLTISPSPAHVGFSPFGLVKGFADANEITPWFVANARGGSFNIEGQYCLISGSLTTTGTLPAPNTQPGGFVSLVVGNSFSTSTALITCSAPAFGGAFLRSDMAIGVTGSQGSKLKLGPGGTCLLWSDGYYWYPLAGYGPFTIAT